MRSKRKRYVLLFMGWLIILLLGCSACKGEEGTNPPEHVTQQPGEPEGPEGQKTPEQTVGEQDILREAPMLRAMTETGKLPSLQKRLPVQDNIAVMVGAITVGVYGDDIQFAVENADKLTGELVSEGLFEYSNTGTIAPNVAKHYTVNSDFTKYTIYLRKGMRWSDGVPFTADDCVFFYEKMCLPEVFGEPLWECFKVQDEKGKTQKATFRKLDTYSFEVSFSQSKPEFLTQLIQQGGICFAPEHYYVNLLPEYMGEDAAKAKAKDMGFTDAAEMLKKTVVKAWNVSGVPTLNAYILSSEEGADDVTGDYYEFVRNPYYWKVDKEGKQLPYMDRLGFTRISGESQKMLLTTEGFLSVSLLNAEQVPEAESGAARGEYRVVTWTSTLSYAIKNVLKNFPESRPYEECVRGIGAAHPETWYVE